MTNLILDDQITAFEKILSKEYTEVNFKDIISLVFHAINKMKDDKFSDQEYSEQTSETQCKKIYDKFEEELSLQNKFGWPQIFIVRNDYERRMDLATGGGSYISSTNILTLLLRILYVENYKRRYVFRSYDYRKVMSHKIRSLMTKQVDEFALEEIIDLLKNHLHHYLKIYNDCTHFENQLATAILKQIE